MKLRYGWLLVIASLWFSLASAVDTQEAFTDPVKQARYEAMTHELRCPKCQNNSIADSDAGIASNLRVQLKALIAAGKSDEEIRAYMTARYSDFVLYNPPVTPRTYLLWASPLLLVLGGLGLAARSIVKRARMIDDGEAIEDSDSATEQGS